MTEDNRCLQMSGVTVWEKRGRLVLDEISWNVYRNKSVLVTGGSGSGRKELFEVIAGYSKQYKGKIVKTGKYAVITEHFPVLEGFFVRDYLIIASGEEGQTDILQRAGDALKKYGLWDKREFKAEHLSLEECCYLQLAMAQVQRPDVILAESCWQYLSTMAQEKYIKCLERSMEEENITFICFTDWKDRETGKLDVYQIQNGVLKPVKEDA